MKIHSSEKYARNEQHGEAVKQYSVDKYAKDELHKQHVKQYSVDKYAKDVMHKAAVIKYNVTKYKTDDLYANNIKTRNAIWTTEMKIFMNAVMNVLMNAILQTVPLVDYGFVSTVIKSYDREECLKKALQTIWHWILFHPS